MKKIICFLFILLFLSVNLFSEKILIVTYTEELKLEFGWIDDLNFDRKPITSFSDVNNYSVLTDRNFYDKEDGSAEFKAWAWYYCNSNSTLSLDVSATPLKNDLNIELPYSLGVKLSEQEISISTDGSINKIPLDYKGAPKADSLLFRGFITKEDLNSCASGTYTATISIIISID